MNSTQATETTSAVHPFERAGLGKAPFKFVGTIQQDLCYGEVILNRAEYQDTGILVTTKPGGTCDYCGTYIVRMFQIQSSDGRTFKVGCDCVAKTGDAKLAKSVDAARRKLTRELTVARETRKADAVRAVLANDSERARLAALPHPNTYRASTGATLLDWAEWMLSNAGRTGKAKVAKVIGVKL